jgi:uncharacterized membrane protein
MLELKTGRFVAVLNSIMPLAWVLLFLILAVIVGYHSKQEFANSIKLGTGISYAALLLLVGVLFGALSLPGLYVLSHAIPAIRAAPTRVSISESTVVSECAAAGSVVIERSMIEDIHVKRGILVIEYIADGTRKSIRLHQMALRNSAFRRFVASVARNLKYTSRDYPTR